MTKDCIHDFIHAWKQWDQAKDQGQEGESTRPLWNVRFQDAGYYSAEPSRDSIRDYWQEIHRWCEQQFDTEHYAWTGSTFWFETEQAAIMFTLRWS
jgi:hypothetical protein